MEKILTGQIRSAEYMKGRTGKARIDQRILYTDRGKVFSSYNTSIVFISEGKTYLDYHYWNYSTTTGKYRNMFLNESGTMTRKKIKTGAYILADLN